MVMSPAMIYLNIEWRRAIVEAAVADSIYQAKLLAKHRTVGAVAPAAHSAFVASNVALNRFVAMEPATTVGNIEERRASHYIAVMCLIVEAKIVANFRIVTASVPGTRSGFGESMVSRLVVPRAAEKAPFPLTTVTMFALSARRPDLVTSTSVAETQPATHAL